MKKLLVFLAIACGTASLAAQAGAPVSVNFFVLEPGSGWGFDTETIADNEWAGIPDFSRVQFWNNLMGGEKGKKASGLITSERKKTELAIAFGGCFSTWNGEHNNQPGKAGVAAWPQMIVTRAVEVAKVNSFAEKYTVVVFLGVQEDSGFTKGDLTLNGNKTAIDPDNLTVVFKDLTADKIEIDLHNRTTGGTPKGVVVIGGLQIVPAS
jgi:hypothetical protein